MMNSRCLLACIATLLCFQAQSSPAQLSRSQSQLKQLSTRVLELQQHLSHSKDKRSVLHQALSTTEKQIGSCVQRLHELQALIAQKTQQLSQLESQLGQSNQQLITQQQLLAAHVRARYVMGEYQPLKWLLNQEDPYKISRLLTYSQYLIASRQHLMQRMDKIKQSISQQQAAIAAVLADNQKMRQELLHHQSELLHDKSYHAHLIQSLDQEIQTQQESLKEAQKNKNNLSHLIQTLAQQHSLRNNRPFAQMRKKLPFPVVSKSYIAMNQGLTFFADEGKVVTAVHAGKVVFSDWLNGYGLLLIIDHGQGFMTLYAHNQSLFKRKGQTVYQNEQIATVGHSGGIKQNGLYFEVRLRGKPLPPLSYLSH